MEPSIESNLMFPLIEAARAYVTLGEMTAALKDVFGMPNY